MQSSSQLFSPHLLSSLLDPSGAFMRNSQYATLIDHLGNNLGSLHEHDSSYLSDEYLVMRRDDENFWTPTGVLQG